MTIWTLQETVKFYNEYAKEYDNDITDYKAPDIIYRSCIKHVKPRCGTGLSSKPFFAHGFQITGVDASSEMLGKAEKFPFKELICQNIEEFKSSTVFDCVICVGVLDFVANPKNLLRSLHNCIGPHSILGITLAETDNGLNAYSEDEMRSLIKDCGYVIVQVDKIVGYRDSHSKLDVYYWTILMKLMESTSE